MSPTLLDRPLQSERLSRRRSLAELRLARRPRGAVLAVITDSLEDVVVARRAAELATSTGCRLVLAVALPGESRIIERDPTDHPLPPDVEAAIGRVRPALDAEGVRYTVVAVPFRERGATRWRSWRITAAILRATRLLDARHLVVGEHAFGHSQSSSSDLPSVAFRLSIAEGSSAAGRAWITVATADSSEWVERRERELVDA